uniref:Uncharacterized protein n=1 Tax=Rangifer tarandus platyrhynchus TaxID=3082113 RepID=A0ACB0E6C6_RANTA|nr:unnamed protein product [Rangifer tarandus platyrhynchus]
MRSRAAAACGGLSIPPLKLSARDRKEARKECPKATAAFCLQWGPGDSESASLLQKAQPPPRSAAQLHERPGKVVHFLEARD